MNFRHKKRERVDITLISMIDVLFVLLLFFMVSTTFNRHSGIKITLPDAKGLTTEKNMQIITLRIDKDGVYSLSNDEGSKQALVNLSIDTLKQMLLSRSTKNKELPFVINADAKTPHQFVISALEVAGQAGFTHITFAAQPTKVKP